jgi:hypothetical protein
MSMDADLANRSHDIHWPRGFTPTDADLFAHSEIYIDACCQRVWRHIVEAARWPEWYPNSKGFRSTAGFSAKTARSPGPPSGLRWKARSMNSRRTAASVGTATRRGSHRVFTIPGIWHLVVMVAASSPTELARGRARSIFAKTRCTRATSCG